MSDVIHLTTGAFPKVSSQPNPVLIDFWAPSAGRGLSHSPLPRSALLGQTVAAEPRCGPCRMQGPILDEVAKAIGPKAVVAKVNVDDEPLLASQFGVQSIPTLVVLKEGRILQRFVGVQPVPVLMGALQQAGGLMDFPWIYLLPVAAIGYLLWSKRSTSTADVKALLERGAQIVDVRTKAEFRSAGHPKAINIPADQLEQRSKELDPAKPVLLCCDSGSRSGFAVAILKRKGFKDVHNLGSWRRIQSFLQ